MGFCRADFQPSTETHGDVSKRGQIYRLEAMGR
jgi:hypothetical protein